MCEFKVFLDGKKVFEDVVVCILKDGELLIKDILGQSKKFSNCHIAEINVFSEKINLKHN